MDELLELKQYIEAERYDDALLLISEMEEMAKEDKLNKISRYIVILLIHLLKQRAEKHSTKSWDTSIYASLFEIGKTNKRKKSGGFYADADDFVEMINEVYPLALRKASNEAFEGSFEEQELEKLVDVAALKQEALAKLIATRN
ncbi:DUF29 family protein [Spirosoma areae]